MNIHITKAGPTLADLQRMRFRNSTEIATLPAVVLTCDPGCESERDAVEAGLALLLLEIGNSAGDNAVGLANALRNPHATEPKHPVLAGSAVGAEVICLASGPSADLAWVAGRQRAGAIVVCVDSIFRGAVAAGVVPDFVCALERDERISEMVPPGLSPDTVLVCPPVVHPSTARGWEGRRIWVWQRSPLYSVIGPGIPQVETGRSAGTLAVMISVLLRPERIILVGHDLCEIDEKSHGTGAEGLSSDLHQVDLANPGNTYHRRASVLCVDGQERPSTLFWRGCLNDIEKLISGIRQPVYQASQKGAAIAGTRSLPGELDWLPRFAALESRYMGRILHEALDQIAEEIHRLRTIVEPEQPTATDIACLLPPRNRPLVGFLACLDGAACTLRMHLDAASGIGREETMRRAWRMLRRRLQQSMIYAENILRNL